MRSEKIQTLLTKQAQEITLALNSGKTLAEQAKTLGLEVKSANGTSRTDTETDREILQYVFGLPAPVDKPVSGSVKTSTGDYAVIALSGVHLATEDKIPAEQRTSVSTMLANISGEYDFKSYQSHLQEVAEIKLP